MAEDIVACTGCGKKFRIPDGSPASGKFACTACGADVTWGGAKPGAASAGGGARASRPRRGAKGARRSKTAAASEPGASSGARRARARRGREAEPETEGAGGGRRGHVPKEKENKTLPLIAALMGAVLLIGGLIVALTRDPPDYDAQAKAAAAARKANGSNDAASDGVSNDGIDSTGTTPDDNAGTPVAPVAPLVPEQPAAGAQPDEESGIGGAESAHERVKDYRYWFLRPLDELFIDIPAVEGTTDEETTRLRELAALATDFDSGANGMRAEGDLAKAGRKAVPFLLSQLQKAWNGSKWQEPSEQFACFKVQQLVREITKADGPPSQLFVRFPPGPGVDASRFQRAARMWIAWWNGEGQHIEEFKSFEDEE